MLYPIAMALAVNVLNAGSHAATDIAPAINAALGVGFVNNPIYVDYDPPASTEQALIDLDNSNALPVSVTTGNPTNHTPYGVANGSYCCSLGQGDDALYYAILYLKGAILSSPLAVQVGGALPAGTAPPTNNTSSSSPGSTNGGTGWGIEFGLATGYLGLDTSEDSWVSAEMAGLLAAFAYGHPNWSWFDVKAALRQTASNWATGYSHTAYGYGFIDWFTANSIASTSSLYLQPPGMSVVNNGCSASITLYPFRQTRRSFERIFLVPASYAWPVANEYKSSTLAASGGVILYSSNGTDLHPQYVYHPQTSGTAHLLAVTSDGAGNYSRVEEFSVVAVPLTFSSSCAT